MVLSNEPCETMAEIDKLRPSTKRALRWQSERSRKKMWEKEIIVFSNRKILDGVHLIVTVFFCFYFFGGTIVQILHIIEC